MRRIVIVLLSAAALIGTLAPAGAHGTHESSSYVNVGEFQWCCIGVGVVVFGAETRQVTFTVEDVVAGSVVGLWVRYANEDDDIITNRDGSAREDLLCTPTASLTLPRGTRTVVVEFRGSGCADRPATTGTLTAHWKDA